MATVSARTKAPVGLLLAVITAEFALGVLGLSARAGSHRPALRPAVVVDATFTRSPGTAGIATFLDPGVAPSASRTVATSSTTAPSTTAPSIASGPGAATPNTATTMAPRAAVLTQSHIASARPTPTTVASATGSGWGCGAAFAFLSAHSAPGYRFVCPGYAEGHQAMTCYNTSACPGDKVIVIAIPCPAAYMNEAHNSWIISGLAQGVIDPFGYCG